LLSSGWTVPRRELKLKPWRPPEEEPEFLLERIERARFLHEMTSQQSVAEEPQQDVKMSLQMSEGRVLVRRPAGVAATHADDPGHGIAG
jgi:hypothetical protein